MALINGSPNRHPIHMPHDSGLSVGSSKDGSDARVRELEDEVSDLADRANVASQRFADYENEIRSLRAKLRQEQQKSLDSAPHLLQDGAPAPPQQPVERPAISRFGSFMGSRKATPTPANGAMAAANAREKELEVKLAKEQVARLAAEKKAKEVNAEIEDLSATLFQQANEMVAAERKQSASLRDKIEVLKQQTTKAKDAEVLEQENVKLRERIGSLEMREADRKRRLERLEAANRRIERVRTMLLPR